jgi:MerR family transcriptional regulator, light-induced transcriptional regulator
MPLSPEARFSRTEPGHDARAPNYSDEIDDTDDGAVSPLALVQLIEARIIPQLLSVHSGVRSDSPDRVRDRISPLQSDGFAALVLRTEAHALMEQVEGFVARGASVESVLLDLLAPAARQLGNWWDEDACDFVDVTMGLWRLQQVVYDLSARFPGKAPNGEGARKALFSVFPGSQHSFGTVVLEECFRRKGWITNGLTSASEAQILALVSTQFFDVVGLSISRECEAQEAAGLIRRIRANSRNKILGVLVGGRVLTETPELALQMGADATASDADNALAKAELLTAVLDERSVTRC